MEVVLLEGAWLLFLLAFTVFAAGAVQAFGGPVRGAATGVALFAFHGLVGLHVARTNPRENPGGNVTLAVVVENCCVPCRAGAFTTISGAASDWTRIWTTVPGGMFLASTVTATGPA